MALDTPFANKRITDGHDLQMTFGAFGYVVAVTFILDIQMQQIEVLRQRLELLRLHGDY